MGDILRVSNAAGESGIPYAQFKEEFLKKTANKPA